MAASSGVRRALKDEPDWPAGDGERPIFLLDASSRLEKRILRAWIKRRRPEDVSRGDYDTVRIPPTRRRQSISPKPLEELLAVGGRGLLAPIRVAWLPRKRNGIRQVRLSDILFGDPRDPGPLRQRWIFAREPDRCRIVAGEPATAGELRERWREACGTDIEETTGLAEFVARQATLALERGERRMRGARYKVPRLVHEDILGRPGFRGGVARLARELSQSAEQVRRRAAADLKEIAATHSPFVIDLAAQLIRLLYTQGYGEALHYDRQALRRVMDLGQRNPIVLLPTHKSNLDHLVLQYALHEGGHAPNHTAGGINMNFFPLGPIVRRSGVFFIRRTFKDDAVYKFTLQHYIDYLIEKRFSLEWYIEGGRSRSGKLLPPRFGLLAYVVDAYRRGKADDVHLIPVSIAYDQISDVGEYAAEQKGAQKQPESFGWFVGMIRRMRRRYGNIHFRFGEPLSLAETLGHPNPSARPNPAEISLEIQKLAFEVCVRINRVTPITESSLVTLAMIGSGFRALSVDEVVEALHNILYFVRTRKLECVGELQLDDAEGVRRTLEALTENGVVTRFSEGLEPVYVIGPDQQLAAAYYRNTVIHFFVNACIAELALLRAGEEGVADPLAEFWEETLRLRDLLKFEFFFAERETFRREIAEELAFSAEDWESAIAEGGEAIMRLLRSVRPYSSHRVLRSFVEAYALAGDLLGQLDPEEPFDEGPFVERCMRVGRQYHLQRRIHSAASVTQVLFKNALKLADNRDLLEPTAPDLPGRRKAFADEIRSVLRRVEAIDALARARRSGLG
ncbi:MAG: glycerol-3-phosphate 1-O-acyltransferase [Myxococcota bacterium]